MHPPVDHLVIGAGLSGLAAARTLHRAGQSVCVLDKGRSVGGRLANRRFDDAIFDIGAQFFTARSPEFKQQVDRWQRNGVVVPWYTDHGEQKWRGAPTMTALAHALAQGLRIHRSTRVFRLSRNDFGWLAACDDGSLFRARSVVLTLPIPQAAALLAASEITPSTTLLESLSGISYSPCIAVMARLKSPSALPAPGVFRSREGPIAWMADNQQKGVSPVPAVTVHASPDFSATHWDTDRSHTGRKLLETAFPFLQAAVHSFQVHGWKYSQSTPSDSPSSLQLLHAPSLVMAGDGFSGGRVEGAVLSGWHSAARLLSRHA